MDVEIQNFSANYANKICRRLEKFTLHEKKISLLPAGSAGSDTPLVADHKYFVLHLQKSLLKLVICPN